MGDGEKQVKHSHHLGHIKKIPGAAAEATNTRKVFLKTARSVVDRSTNDVEQFVGDGLLPALVVLQIEFAQ